MTQAASQASIFFEQVAREGRLFTFLDDGDFMVFRMSTGEVIPFWSSRSRLVSVQKGHPKYRSYDIDETSLADFVERVLPQLQSQDVRVGVNWSGERLTGYDYTVDEVRKNLDHWIRKVQKAE